MKHLSTTLTLILVLQLLLFSGCAGYQIPEMEDRFLDYQVWEESSYDLFFYYSSEYYNYENSTSNTAGRLKVGEKEYPLHVGVDGSGGLHFVSHRKDGEKTEILFEGYFVKSEPDFYEIRVHNSKIPDILPDDTILHFDISDVEAEDLYIPEFLGKRTK